MGILKFLLKPFFMLFKSKKVKPILDEGVKTTVQVVVAKPKEEPVKPVEEIQIGNTTAPTNEAPKVEEVKKEDTPKEPIKEKEPAPITNTPTTTNSNQEPSKKMSYQDQVELLLLYVLYVEGEYSNDKNDSGGETRYGIIKEEARRWGYTGDMRKFPKEKAIEIYKKDYIEKFKIDKIDHLGKKLALFDVCVNSGNRGVKLAQRVVNKVYIHRKDLPKNLAEMKDILPLAEDGQMGPKTINAINAIPFFIFYTDFIVAHEDMYHDLMKANPKNYDFEEGWENRIHKENQYIYRLLKDGLIDLY